MTQVDLMDQEDAAAADEYRALVRALRRKQGFGLFFVQASPAQGAKIFTDLQRDLPSKRMATVTLNRQSESLFEQLEAIWQQQPVDLFWIEGLEQALLGYEDVKRLAGWDEEDLITYSWKDVPLILSHLNLGRERFQQRFACALVFVVPLFAVKYLLRRAGDFFDWRSGFFEFPDDRQQLAQEVLNQANYAEYRKLDAATRIEKILQIKDLLDEPKLDVDWRAALLREIGRLFDAGEEYEQAIAFFDQAIQINPDLQTGWLNLGYSLNGLGRYEEAIAAFQRAIKLNPQDVSTYNSLGIAYFHQKDYPAAIAAYKCAIELAPQDASAYHFLGFVYSEQKNYPAAIAAYERVIDLGELDLKYVNVYYQLGIAYFYQKDYPAAIAAYRRAIELDPKDAIAYYLLGGAYKNQKDFPAAITAYKRAIELDPTDDLTYYHLGDAYCDLKDYPAAIAAYQQTIELNSSFKEAFAKRGQVYRLIHHYENALKDFDRAIELDNEYPSAFAQRGRTYQALGRFEEALKDCDRAIELDQEYSWAIAQRGQTYQALDRFEEALKDFNRAIELSPDSDWNHYLRALTCCKLDQPELAKTGLQQAIKLVQAKLSNDLTDDSSMVNLPLYHLAAGNQVESDRLYQKALSAPVERIHEAIHDLQNFIALFPDHPTAHQALQQLQQHVEQVTETDQRITPG